MTSKPTGKRRQSTLDYMMQHGMIDRARYEAATLFIADYELATTSAHLTMDLSAPIPKHRRSGPGTISDAVIDAVSRCKAALAAVGAPINRLILDVCINDLALLEIERDQQWPRSSAKIVIAIALERLARHYRLVVTAPSYRKRDARAA
jgi:hypothetical protein